MSTNESAGFFGGIGYDPSDQQVPEDVPRDQWGRPLIIDLQTGEMVAYTRASTMSNYIANKSGLHIWQKRNVARGMGLREDLAAMAAALPVETGNKRKDADMKKELDEVIAAAEEAADAHYKANWGTAVHAFTDPTFISGPVPERMQPDVESHKQVTEAAGIVRFCSEIFVVNDELKVAGTLDAILGIPALGVAVPSDTKTGKADIHSTLIQVAIYSRSSVYNWETGERIPLQDFLAQGWPERVPPLVADLGLYVHIPRGEGKTTLHPLDLNVGWEMAQLCARVRDFQRDKGFIKDDTAEWLAQHRNEKAFEAIFSAGTVIELREICHDWAWAWNDRLSKAGQARFEELGGPAQAKKEGVA